MTTNSQMDVLSQLHSILDTGRRKAASRQPVPDQDDQQEQRIDLDEASRALAALSSSLLQAAKACHQVAEVLNEMATGTDEEYEPPPKPLRRGGRKDRRSRNGRYKASRSGRPRSQEKRAESVQRSRVRSPVSPALVIPAVDAYEPDIFDSDVEGEDDFDYLGDVEPGEPILDTNFDEDEDDEEV